MGGRMPLSSLLSDMLRKMIHQWNEDRTLHQEIEMLEPLFLKQEIESIVPRHNQLLIESLKADDGHHLFFYPFEGRFVHEGLAALFAYRIGKIKTTSFSIAMNDYGFELLSDEIIPIEDALEEDLFSLNNLSKDIKSAVNDTEMARRKFRDIARVAGLVFQGYPGRAVKERHLQSSSSLFFQVFMEYDKDNLLLRQAFEEVYDFQLEQQRMTDALKRINEQEIVVKQITQPTPFSFPILVDSLREKFSNESMEERVRKMIEGF
jgi:ATP-dependent Lhr-like helicase